MLFYKGFDKMKIILTIAISFIALTILAQDKLYTKGLPNGYAWIAPLSISHPVYGKEESILASIQDRLYTEKFNSSKNKQRFPLGCESYIDTLLTMGKSGTINIKDVVKEIDYFYTFKENLIIPVLGAYCISIQKITGISDEEIEEYKKELREFSKTDE